MALCALGLAGREVLVGGSAGVFAPPAVAEPVLPLHPLQNFAPGTPAFARAGPVTLYVPTRHPVVVGYHEAWFPERIRMRPLGRCLHDFNKTRFRRPRSSMPGPRYLVMPSRGRGDAATTAADVAMRTKSLVLSPVTGTVVSVRRYMLYGRYHDFRIEFLPMDDPLYRVVIIHVTRVRVRAGSWVVAGVTRLGRPRDLPFESQVNDYVGPHIQHVHIEVMEIGAPSE